MTSRGATSRMAAAGVALIALAGCAADVAATTAASSGAAREAPVEELATAGDVPPAVCETEALTLETAAEAHRATEGVYPASAAALVGTYLTEAPRYHELRLVSDTEVEVVPVPGAGCD
ncbi:MAG TPA: hypothetical protein VGO60_01715 [Iamia sp.]|nr:hypothetical protein [Iamia sp.]